jgi:hypothetical protein
MRKRQLQPVAHIALGFADADAWDRVQLSRLTLAERLQVAEELKRRAYGEGAPDVRAAQRRS